MIRTEIQLSEEQFERLAKLAAARHVSISQLIQGLVLADEEEGRRWARLAEVLGSCHDPAGADRVAENHDRFLNDLYSRGLDLP